MADLTDRETASSAFTYSLPRSGGRPEAIRADLGIGTDCRVFLVALSSNDEVRAARTVGTRVTPEPTVFADQFEWLREILDLADRNSNWVFIIRLHPRMLPNQREGRVAPDVMHFRQLLDHVPSNVITNDRQKHLSVYDLMRISDTGLVRSSTGGLEMVARGIPVVSSDSTDIRGFPPSLALVARSRSEYQQMLGVSLKVRNHERVALAASAWRYMYFRDYVVARPVPWRKSQDDSREGVILESATRGVVKKFAHRSRRLVPSVLIPLFRALRSNLMARQENPSEPIAYPDGVNSWVNPFERTLLEASQSLVVDGEDMGGFHTDRLLLDSERRFVGAFLADWRE